MRLKERWHRWRDAEKSQPPAFDESFFETNFDDLFSMAGAGQATDQPSSSAQDTADIPSFEEVMANLRHARAERLAWLGALSAAFSGLGHGFMHIGCCAASGAMSGGFSLPNGGHFHIGLDGSKIFHEHDHAHEEKKAHAVSSSFDTVKKGQFAKNNASIRSRSNNNAENPFAWLLGPEKTVGLSALFAL